MSSPTPPGQPPRITFSSPTPEPESDSEVDESPSAKPEAFRARSTQLQSRKKPASYLKGSESGHSSSESEGSFSTTELSDRELSDTEVTQSKVKRRKARRDRQARRQAGSTTMFEGKMLIDDLCRLPTTGSLNTSFQSDASSEEDTGSTHQDYMSKEDIVCLIQGMSSAVSIEAGAIHCDTLLRMCKQLKNDTEALIKMGSVIKKGLETDLKLKALPNKELLLRQIKSMRTFCKKNILAQQKLIKSAAQNGYNFLIPVDKKSTASLTDFAGKNLRTPISPKQKDTADVSYSYDLLKSNFSALMQIAWNWKVEWVSCEHVSNFTKTELPDDFRSKVEQLTPPTDTHFLKLFEELHELYKLAEKVNFVAPSLGKIGSSPTIQTEQTPEQERSRAKPDLDLILGSISTTSHPLAPLPTDYLYAHGLENPKGGAPIKIYKNLLDECAEEAQEIISKAKAVLIGLSRQSETYEDMNFERQKTIANAKKMLPIGRQLDKKWHTTTPSMQRVYTDLIHGRQSDR